MVTKLENRSPDIRNLNTVKARVSGILLPDFRATGTLRPDASDRRK
jgi:hypothetical protein